MFNLPISRFHHRARIVQKVLGPVFLGLAATHAAAQPGVLNTRVPIRAVEVQFSVHVPGDLEAAAVRGTRYLRSDVRPDARAILLLHGVVSTRAVWEGMVTAPSTALALAEAGYAVFAIDRLGYGLSTYDRGAGSGWALTPESTVAITQEIVSQIRKRTYRIAVGRPLGSLSASISNRKIGPRPRSGHKGVVLVGHSIGGAQAVLYTARHGDIDAVIPVAWSNHGAGSIVGEIFADTIVPQFQQGKDFVSFFIPDGTGFSERCVQTLFHPPGADPAVVDRVCGGGFFETSPSAEVASIAGEIQAATLGAIPSIGNVPVLLVFAAQDNIFPPAGHGGASGDDSDVVSPEIQYWEAHCGCELNIYFQNLSGHVNFFHRSAGEWIEATKAFLRDRGL